MVFLIILVFIVLFVGMTLASMGALTYEFSTYLFMIIQASAIGLLILARKQRNKEVAQDKEIKELQSRLHNVENIVKFILDNRK